jgi:hypothetical protein
MPQLIAAFLMRLMTSPEAFYKIAACIILLPENTACAAAFIQI